MKKLVSVCAIALCCIAQPVFAQNDAKAKGILEAVSKKVNGLKSMKANFSLKIAGANGKVMDTKKGTFYLKGPKYRISLGEQEIICDNRTVWTYLKDIGEVQVSSYNPNDQTISPAKLFTNFYDKEYRYKYAGEKTKGGKKYDMIILTPSGSGKQFSKVELMVNKDKTIAGGKVYEKNGNQYEYEVSNFQVNPAISDSYFTFDKSKHPNVEVVDLR